MRTLRSAPSLHRRDFFAAGGAVAATWLAPSLAFAQAPAGAPKLSRAIAEFVTGFALGEAPPLAVERARTAFADTVGVMLAGSRQKVAAIVVDMVRAEAAAPTVSVVGQSLRTTPQFAALANGVATHALDYDFTYLMGQLAAPVIPSLLPLAESLDASQSELLAAFIVGFEVCSRIGRANPDHNSHGSWHGTGTIGTIAAAAAAARLLKAPAAAIPDIIGIGVSTAAGVNANYGTMTKPLHAGMAARNGITAAMLGMRGFSANGSALEGRGGFGATFARGLEWHPEAFADLGRTFDLAERGFKLKRYPCGGVTHTSIDAALILRDRLAPRLADISAIRVGTSKYASLRAGEQYPTSTESAKFHLPYLVAYTILRGAPNLASFTESAVADDQVKALSQKVKPYVDPAFADQFEESPSRLVVAFADGSSLEEVRLLPSGTSQFPMSEAQIRDKFFDCAALSVDRDAAETILATLSRLGDQASLRDLWPLLRRA
jgi:2-methylcitrate dehydratase PrpD